MGYKYEEDSYRSPQRVWDKANQEYLDLWLYQHVFDLELPDGRHVVIEPPFEYDKGSVPDVAQGLLPRDDRRGVIGFLFHDWLYEKQQIEGEWITRKEADQILYDLLRHSGMRWSKAKLIYLLVRSGGWIFFNHRAKTIGNIHYI